MSMNRDKQVRRVFDLDWQTRETKRLKTSNTEQVIISSTYDIDTIESQILGLVPNYNEITTLIRLARQENQLQRYCLSCLCKVFCVLNTEKRMTNRELSSENEKLVARWLIDRYQEYQAILYNILRSNDAELAIFSNSLLIQLVKAELNTSLDRSLHYYSDGNLFSQLISDLLAECNDDVFDHFVHAHIDKDSSICSLSVRCLVIWLLSDKTLNSSRVDRCIQMLLHISQQASKSPETSLDAIQSSVQAEPKRLRPLHKSEIEKAWLAVFKLQLNSSQRRKILAALLDGVAPHMSKPEFLLDFLTDCCDQGNSEALLALSGLHTLIQDHGLDYPQLYSKLYSLLDHNMLHKRQRSDLLRLIDKFLKSTHLPSAIVASFIKRLARLCLYSPPSAIVATVPLIYNLLQSHRACSLMLQRSGNYLLRDPGRGEVLSDSFDASENDPNLTRAIHSSLWELHSLASHWHPNVATISRILGEQFLKQSYDIEHFLDHSYRSLALTEAGKKLSKDPPVEHQISSVIFSLSNERNDLPGLSFWSFRDKT